MKKTIIVAALCGIGLAGCVAESKDYDAAAFCQGQGMRPGDAGYDKCVQNEQTGKLMDQQHKEFDDNQQKLQDYRAQPYNGYGR
jgi:hypothetical protein